MQKILPYLAIVMVLLYALYNAKFKHTEKKHLKINNEYVEHLKTHKNRSHYEEELSIVNSSKYVEQYIINVINHGSAQFNFKGGIMDGGFASKTDAPKIACYVLELSGKKCKSPYPNDAAMFYTSICGGCHGDDGKGLGGTYPDLTKKRLLGIQKREDFLKTLITTPRRKSK